MNIVFETKEKKTMLLYMPTKVYSEMNCVRKYGNEMSSYGKKAMIVTGRISSRKNGSLQDVEATLNEAGISYIIFDEIEENPSIETIMKARNVAIQEEVDFVIGIGGGSPLDAAKAIALMSANPNENEDVLYDAKSLQYLPVVCVPTTCGTGSEVTPYSILTIHHKRTKQSISHKIYPSMAFLDAQYLKSMTRDNLVNTTVDALAHLIESYLNTNSNELNAVYSKEGLRIWGRFKNSLLHDDITDNDYENMLYASMIAGIAISHTGTSLPHGLSYVPTYELGIPHGRAVGAFLGGFVEVYQDKEAVADVLEWLDFEKLQDFQQYMRLLLGKVEISDAIMQMNAEKLMDNKAKLKNYPFDINKEELINLRMHV